MKSERLEHITGGPSRFEKQIRHFAEGQNVPIGVLEQSLYEFSFQVLSDTYDAADKERHEIFLNQLFMESDIATKENTKVIEDSAHGWYIKVELRH